MPKPIPDYSLYVITGESFSKGRSTEDVIRQAILGGATVIQLREKEYCGKELIRVGKLLRDMTREMGVTFIVNDRVDVAFAVDADGVHLGQDDLPIEVARQILGPDKIVGISAGNMDEVLAAQARGADYVGLGPVFATGTKSDAGEAVGLDLVKQVCARATIPVVGIGGIKANNAAQVIEAGAAGVSVITAVVSADDVTEAARQLRHQIDLAKGLKG
ncbi:Thiamine-phosphate pyrophosphorylase [Desulfotomaculum nigrificans CO-1-SRB]|uniref:Thiamine-phosphate synthase n=1 Tax=Desulfotomaculum nigrificans (strain DSM 14880 / VKM B-2319 / CO-1-SRB) TaxID=868595 RepID=F6B7A2_DESCC|nr:thiamine phosphate synthase [Desulfotomaculum nigrificans]AEF93352.1 Thiamine-phosphate pyrophosphorylase [Desulfotomaculum nigrificans CO-1-SRB]